MDLKTQILVALGLDKSEEETKLSFQAKLVDGTIIVSEDDTLAEGSLVSVLTEDGTTMPLPAGEYRTEDGLGFVVETEGEVSEMLPEEAPETEETPEEEVAPELEEVTEEVVEEEKAELEDEVMEEEVTEEAPIEEAPVQATPKSITTTTTEKVEFNKEDFLTEINDSIVALKAEIETLKTENVELKSQLEESATSPVNVNKFSKESKTLSPQELSRMTRQERYLYKLTK